YLGTPLVFHWTGMGAAAERFIVGHALLPGTRAHLEHVRVIDVSNTASLREIARKAGLTEQDLRKQGFRRLDGRLMERLACASPLVVGFDLKYVKPSSFDDDFARGARVLRSAGIGTTVCFKGWEILADGKLGMSDAVARQVHYGSSSAEF